MRLAPLLLALLLVACAEEAPPPAATTPSPFTSPEPTEESPAPEPEVECVDATASGRSEVAIRMVDDEFVPACLTMLGGQSLRLTNRGSSVHNFSVEGSDVSIDVGPGESVRTQAIAGAVRPGTRAFFCEYHRSRGMEGEVTISEAG